jgi:hypothetical protein
MMKAHGERELTCGRIVRPLRDVLRIGGSKIARDSSTCYETPLKMNRWTRDPTGRG